MTIQAEVLVRKSNTGESRYAVDKALKALKHQTDGLLDEVRHRARFKNKRAKVKHKLKLADRLRKSKRHKHV